MGPYRRQARPPRCSGTSRTSTRSQRDPTAQTGCATPAGPTACLSRHFRFWRTSHARTVAGRRRTRGHEAGLSLCVPTGEEHRWRRASGPGPADLGAGAGSVTHHRVGPRAPDSALLGLLLVPRKGHCLGFSPFPSHRVLASGAPMSPVPSAPGTGRYTRPGPAQGHPPAQRQAGRQAAPGTRRPSEGCSKRRRGKGHSVQVQISRRASRRRPHSPPSSYNTADSCRPPKRARGSRYTAGGQMGRTTYSRTAVLARALAPVPPPPGQEPQQTLQAVQAAALAAGERARPPWERGGSRASRRRLRTAPGTQ